MITFEEAVEIVRPANLPNIRDHTVRVLSVHQELMEALTALELLTTACATNAEVMKVIDLHAFDVAVEAEERARKAVNEIGGGI